MEEQEKRGIEKQAGPKLGVQAAGHANSLLEDAEDSGFILKPFDEVEVQNYEELWASDGEPLLKFVATYGGTIKVQLGGQEETAFARIGNLLDGFQDPCVMDCKLGVRTFQESEAASTKPRADLFKKMLKLMPGAVTAEEHAAGSITKHRWLSARDAASTTTTLGFRIEGITSKSGSRIQQDDLKGLCKVEDVYPVLPLLLPPKIPGDPQGTKKQRISLMKQILHSLTALNHALNNSKFSQTHEFIGCSLLFVCDVVRAAVYMIDFAKTTPLPEGTRIDHSSDWKPGNHEDGFQRGLVNLLDSWKEILRGIEKVGEPTSYFKDAFQDEEIARLEKLLSEHGVDTAQFGVGKAKSMAELFWEIHIEKAVRLEVNEKGKLVRIMDVVKAWIIADIDGADCTLMESKHHRVDSVRSMATLVKDEMKPIQKKLGSGESWEEALHRVLEERLEIFYDPQEPLFNTLVKSYRAHTREELGTAQHGFPGLVSVYRVHEVDMMIPRPWTCAHHQRIGLPQGNPFTTISHVSLSSFGSQRRTWRWISLSDTDYGTSPAVALETANAGQGDRTACMGIKSFFCGCSM